MDPEVRSTKPGDYPKCGMTLVIIKSVLLSDSTKANVKTKAQLLTDSLYNYRLKEACDECYRDGENCECYTSVKKTGVVYKECYKDWHEGDRCVPGIKKARVNVED